MTHDSSPAGSYGTKMPAKPTPRRPERPGPSASKSVNRPGRRSVTPGGERRLPAPSRSRRQRPEVLDGHGAPRRERGSWRAGQRRVVDPRLHVDVGGEEAVDGTGSPSAARTAPSRSSDRSGCSETVEVVGVRRRRRRRRPDRVSPCEDVAHLVEVRRPPSRRRAASRPGTRRRARGARRGAAGAPSSVGACRCSRAAADRAGRRGRRRRQRRWPWPPRPPMRPSRTPRRPHRWPGGRGRRSTACRTVACAPPARAAVATSTKRDVVERQAAERQRLLVAVQRHRPREAGRPRRRPRGQRHAGARGAARAR